MTSKPHTNQADDADWIQALEEIETYDAEIDEEKADSRDRISSIKDRQKRKVEMLCRELGIDKELFKAALADRADDRKHFAKKQKRAAKIPDAKIEYWADVTGQYHWLPPGDAPEGVVESFAERANRERIEAIQKITDEEAAAGAEALDQLAQVH